MRLAKPITYAVAVAILVAWFTYKPLATFLKKRRAVMQLPGPPIDNFFMGNTSLLSIERPKHARLLTDLMYNYGGEAGVIRLLVGPLPQVSVSSPEGIKIVLGSSKHSKKGSLYSFLYSWLGTGLLTSEGTKWKTRRRMITPTFHFDILKRFLEVMNEQTNTLIKRMEEKSKKGPVEAFELITLCALDIISETAMGRKVNAQLSDGKNEYVECVYKGSKAIMDRLEKPWLFPEWAYRLSAEGRENRKVIAYLHEYSRKVIGERKEKLKEEKASQFEGEKSRPAFLDILLAAQYEDGRPLDDEDIREEVDTFMFEGHDTTSASIAWTLQLLGLHPEIQTAVQQEVDVVLGDSDTVTYEMLGEFKYLEMVLKESLRVFPSVPFIERVLTEDAMLGGVNVPAGTNIDIQIYALHHSPRYWDEPEVFKPERWADESEERDPYKYIPFSAGPRNCIGQKFAQNEEKVMIAKIMKHFTVKSLKQEVPSYPELILRPGEVTLEIQRR